MSKRLAITIAGAVSLGSYEAGVLYEILQAIASNNAAASTDDDKIFIDVITGASAGAMCATILAQKLLYDGNSLTGAPSNALMIPGL
jgi:predicted acylesterase/phospholipase RssA